MVVAEPELERGECGLGDGYAFWDRDTGTWHYLAQMLSTSRRWNIDHFSRRGPDPMGRFDPDPGNPVIRRGALWSRICGPSKSCPRAVDEGTPEIVKKANGFYYVTFHGVNPAHAVVHAGNGTRPVMKAYRGIAKTRDWHTWVTDSDDLPADAIWSSRDCQGWSVRWSQETGCIGGGHASTLITPTYMYMLIELADLSIDCTAGQHWVIGLVRTRGPAKSGEWEQYAHNPLMSHESGGPCSIQYPRLFADAGYVYLSYWTLGPKGARDPDTMFHVAILESRSIG